MASTDRPGVLEQALSRQGTLVLDGALATELERRGADLSGPLWSARLLLDRPELIARVHRDYFEAGADVAITASYQASVPGFVRMGIPPKQAAQLIQRSVTIARAERDTFWAGLDDKQRSRRLRPVVATSVGPYGAVLADGSEYRGGYDLTDRELVRFHVERLEVLLEPGVEVLACETIPSLTEARALVEALSHWPDVRVWVSFSARSGTEISDGTPAAACAVYLHEQEQVSAVGINCTAPVLVPQLVRELSGATDRPIVAYPNSGETYEAVGKTWRDRPTAGLATAVAAWQAAGARLIGGCCRTRPADIRAVREALSSSRPSSTTSDGEDMSRPVVSPAAGGG